MAKPQLIHHFTDQDVFDGMAFERRLAILANPLQVFRQALKQGDETLKSLFQEGVSASELVPARARLIDQLLTRAWGQFFAQPDDPHLALVAVGGYGRGELHPHSDVDIMILLGSEDIDRYRTALEGFMTFLWDMGLEVGHSVRNLEQCVRLGEADITEATSQMEARLLVGSAALEERMRQLTGPENL